MNVYVTITSASDRRNPNTVAHLATIHDMNDTLIGKTALDGLAAMIRENGYVIVGENPAERARINAYTSKEIVPDMLAAVYDEISHRYFDERANWGE